MSTQQDEEIDRIFKLLDDGLETQVFKKTRLTGVDVHSSLLSVIERRTSSSPSSSVVKQDDSIARMLYEDDPFAIAPASFSSVDRSSSNSSRVIVNDKLSSAQQSTRKRPSHQREKGHHILHMDTRLERNVRPSSQKQID